MKIYVLVELTWTCIGQSAWAMAPPWWAKEIRSMRGRRRWVSVRSVAIDRTVSSAANVSVAHTDMHRKQSSHNQAQSQRGRRQHTQRCVSVDVFFSCAQHLHCKALSRTCWFWARPGTSLRCGTSTWILTREPSVHSSTTC